MECILEQTNNVMTNQEEMLTLEPEPEPEPDLEPKPYVSVFKLLGKPIISPLMSPERRVEMQAYRTAAIRVEQKLKEQAKTCVVANKDCHQLVDASTNTEPISKLMRQPLIVIGRKTQRLQFSETLIYDNVRNAILKVVNPSTRPNFKKQEKLLETAECVKCNMENMIPQPQIATTKLPKFGFKSEKSVLTARRVLEQVRAQIEGNKAAELLRKQNLKETNRLVKENLFKTDRKIERAATHPSIPSRAERDALIAKMVRSMSNAEGKGRLHAQLWRCYHSNPVAPKLPPKEPIAPSSLNVELICQQIKAIAKTRTPTTARKAKPRISTATTARTARTPSTSRPKPVHTGAVPKQLSSNNSCKLPKMTPRVMSAHASSHANLLHTGSDSRTRMSSTQRRLSYDPRATLKSSTLKSSTTPKRATLSATSALASSHAQPSLLPAPKVSKLPKPKSLEEMEQQQRQRIQSLVTKQADEQKRLQTVFQTQQQDLMNQLLSDVTGTSDKNSESSSLTSLPQNSTDPGTASEPTSNDT